MIAAEIRVNGALVGVVNVQNVGEIQERDGVSRYPVNSYRVCRYNVESYNFTTRQRLVSVVDHDRNAPWETLFAEVFASLLEQQSR